MHNYNQLNAQSVKLHVKFVHLFGDVKFAYELIGCYIFKDEATF